MSTSATQPIITPSDSTTTATDTPIYVGTRKSVLALKQADFIIAELSKLHPGQKFEIRRQLDSAGDIDKTTSLHKLAGDGRGGLWTNELEAELVIGAVDFVVHCLKDMPTSLPQNCDLACVPLREDPRDVLVVKASLSGTYSCLEDLPEGAVVGTSSIRRMAQLRRRYPKLSFQDMRGNLDTRLRKLDDPESPYTCLILAAAGLRRMSLDKRITQCLDSRPGREGGGMVHAVGQGALGLEIRTDDAKTRALLAPLEDLPTRLACEAERSLMRELEGGCSVPIGAETEWVQEEGEKKKLRLTATVVSVDGKNAVDSEKVASVASIEEAVAFGKEVADKLRELGAQPILDVIVADRQADQANAKPWVPA